MRSSSVRDDILALTEAATAVAVSVLLGNLRLLELPSGGSITLACVPLLAFAALRGVRRGIFVCACAGFAHAASGGTIIHPVQLLLDYGAAYAAYALAGFARASEGWRLHAAIVVAGCASLAATSVSGAIFFAQGFSSMHGALTYAALYNAATIVPEVVLAIVFVPPAARAITRADPARAPRASAGAPPAPRRSAHPRSLPRVQEEVEGIEPTLGALPRSLAPLVRPSPFGR